MRGFLLRKLAGLCGCTSGNAVMLVALGMPVLIGGTGLAVDTSQWYMWKGELQYAADQAAIAGAWARARDATEDSYVERAQQEYASNLSTTDDIATSATVSLENYASGTLNSVVVTASATKRLPFSYFLTGQTATVSVNAQAAFEPGVIVSSCLVAVDDDATGAITFGGSAEFVAGCGVKALSTADEAISVLGNPTINAGTLIAAGGIDDWFSDTTNENNIGNTPIANFEGQLVDDFAELDPPSPPQSQVTRGEASDYCPTGQTTESYIADSVTTRTQITYSYWTKSGNDYSSYSYTGSAAKTNVDTTVSETDVTLDSLPAGAPNTTVVTGPTDSGYVQIDRISGTRIYEKSTTTTTKTYVNARLATTAEDGGAAVLQPGTYTDMTIRCDTVFRPGVYVLSGGNLEIHGQYDVTGTGVMFVLKDGAGIVINGGSSVNLTAMTVAELQTAGLSYDDAIELEGMLIFEDRDSPGNTGNKLNGNANTVLNGSVYLPVSNLDIRGSAGVTSQCLLLVASTITISGNVEMTSFCPPNLTQEEQSTTLQARVRLVS
jgi:Flp pilus assembly protein TadG